MFLFFIFSISFSQDYDFQELCIACAESQGFYCGDDPANWTQYSPEGCVQNSWINDGWIDCVDATDENGAVPTLIEECTPPPPICDTIYIVEYLDCETGLPCYVGLPQLIKESENTDFLYNLNGDVIAKPQGVYIENGQIKYNIK